MNPRQLFLAISIVISCTLGLYLLIAFQLLQEPDHPYVRESSAQPPAAAPFTNAAPALKITTSAISTETPSAISRPSSSGRKLVEIFGRVSDRDGRPIEDALVAEERYFISTRTDAEGNYRIRLDLPQHRYPILHFLRNGYDGRRLRLSKKELDQSPAFELDVELEDALSSVNLQGWVGNESGIGLEGARVELAASYTRNRESFYLTEFTDASGRFEFEGVRAGETYRFSIRPKPAYPYYEDPDFEVTQNPAPLSIVLKHLEFAEIDGMIVDRNSTPVANYEMYVSNITTGIHSRKIVSDSSGFFTLRNFPLGELDLTTRGAEFFRIAGVKLTASSYQNLRLVVDRGGQYLTGWVADENGVAVEKAMVTLDRKFFDDGVESSSYRSRRTDRNGRFAFADLGDGSYQVTVYAQGYEKQAFQHDFDTQPGEVVIMLKPYRQ